MDHDLFMGFIWLIFGPVTFTVTVIALVILVIRHLNGRHRQHQQWLRQLPPPPPGAWQDPSGQWHNPAYYEISGRY